MLTLVHKQRWFGLAFLLVWSLTHASARGQDVKVQETQAEKVRKALDQTVSLDFSTQSFQEVVRHLKEKTSVNFVLDLTSLQQMGLGFEEVPAQLQLKCERVKLRQAVQRMLNAHNLTFVILEDAVLITTEEMGLARQMRQRVSVQVEETPVHKALKDLARATALNLVIDPRLGNKVQNPVTLQVEDATLETAVRLVAELGGLKSVRMGNILFVTSEERAEKIRKEEPPVVNPMNDFAAPAVIPARGGFGGGGIGAIPGPPLVIPEPGRAIGAPPRNIEVRPDGSVPAQPPLPKE